MKLYRVAQIRQLEQAAIEQFDIPEGELMQTAGQAAFELCRQQYPEAKRYHIFCGPGNNGGDGFVVATKAKQAGLDVLITMLAVAPTEGAAAQAYQACVKAGVKIQYFDSQLRIKADLMIDAIFGIGLVRDVASKFAQAITMINASEIPVIAIDCPSGLAAETGHVLGTAINATHTITFIGAKVGFFLAEARSHCGQIHVHDLTIPQAAFTNIKAPAEVLAWSLLQKKLPARQHTAHKGDFGHVLVIGGDYGFAGAALMAGLASARVGAGLTSIATRPEHAHSLFTQQPELMAHAIEQVDECKVLLERASVIVIGPGLGRSQWAKQLTEVAFASHKPCVIDADALAFFADAAPLAQPVVITPHPGEAGQLLGCSAAEIQQQRLQAVTELQEKFHCVCILKGANTLIARGDDAPVKVCDAGNPGMASGGMGDVLSGVIAGLMAQGLSAADAAELAVMCHARAGDRAALVHGQRGILATDLLPHIQDCLNEET